MKYLLGVNVLVALGLLQHEFHERVAGWVRTLASRGIPELATCSITELGFVRVLAQAPQYGFTITHARTALLRLKTGNSLRFTFIPDDHDVSHIPAWVKTAKQITDGHLVQLAKAKNAILATLDERLPGAFLIPTQR
ncbi:MAG TPA: PIN domain-containing protein [Terriglobales bacterium]|nr:PIN domain-containing protein [Terriglobales bacterium]